MSKVNIKVLAEQLQLSVSTISKALRDSYEISDETKKKVLELATQLNYVPNPYASSLRKRRARPLRWCCLKWLITFFTGHQWHSNYSRNQRLSRTYLSIARKIRQRKNHTEDCQSGRVDGVLISYLKRNQYSRSY